MFSYNAVITNVRADNIEADSAKISWNTSTNSAIYSIELFSNGQLVKKRTTGYLDYFLTELNPCTTYRVSVSSGNEVKSVEFSTAFAGKLSFFWVFVIY